MSDQTFEVVIGLLLFLLGIILLFNSLLNRPKKNDNVFGQSAENGYLILGITLVISGLIIAFR